MNEIIQGQIDIQAFIQEGMNLLQENMESYPSFDPTRPYEEKNAYFMELAQRGEEIFFQRELHWFAEIYFKTLLDEILNYEETHDKHFNKGMVYANLGISQMALGKVDAGIAHILAADEEDRPFVQDPHGILNTRLWRQFERQIITDYLIDFNQDANVRLNFQIDNSFLEDFLTSMDLQDRLFFEGTIWALRDNMRQNQLVPNAYTRGRLFSGVKDMCLLTEAMLRRHQVLAGVIQEDDRVMLGQLLTNALSNQNIGYPQAGLNTGANNSRDFVNNLENIFTNSNSPEILKIYCLWLVRNFTGHHFDLSETIVSQNGNSFFDMYERALKNIVSALLYLRNINAI